MKNTSINIKVNFGKKIVMFNCSEWLGKKRKKKDSYEQLQNIRGQGYCKEGERDERKNTKRKD